MNTIDIHTLIELFSFPFMQRALLAGVFLAPLLASLGVFVTLRNMSLFGEGIAHSSLAGIAIAVIAGVAPLPVALGWAVLVALFLYWLERSTRLPSDMLIGIFFTASMAFGVVLMSFTHGYQPELVTFLFGSILAIKQLDLLFIVVLSTVILFWISRSYRHLTYLSLSEESASVAGINTTMHNILLYVSLALATVLGVKILGIILISALLILPPATSRLLTQSFRSYFTVSIVLAEITILIGLIVSYLFDLPSGATIVLIGTAFFLIALLSRRS